MGGDKASRRDVAVAELSLGPELPTLRIGEGPKTLVYLPGLSLHPGLPTGYERRMATSGWEPLLDTYSLYRIGRRVRPIGTTFGEMAEDVSAAIEDLRPPVDLMGASTGGVLALHVAAARPDLVRRLVLVISGSSLSAAGRDLGARVTTAARAGKWRSVYAAILPIGANSRFGRSALAALGWLLGPRLMGVPSDPTLFLAELDAWLNVGAAQSVNQIGCPTLVIGGASDRVFPPAATLALADQIADHSVVIVPKLVHDFPARLTSEYIAPFLLR